MSDNRCLLFHNIATEVLNSTVYNQEINYNTETCHLILICKLSTPVLGHGKCII